MPYYREGMDAHVRESVFDKLHSSFIQTEPLLYFLGLVKGENMQKLGTPSTMSVFGSGMMGEAEREETGRAAKHEFEYQKTEPDDGGNVASGGTTPVASAFAEDNVGTGWTGWTLIMEPVKIRVQSLEDAHSETAVGAVVEKATSPIVNRWIKRIATGIWSDSLTQTQQAKRLWEDGFLGLTHTLTADNYYAQIDRSAVTAINPMSVDASTHFSSPTADLNFNRWVNVGYVRADTSADVTGLAVRSENGMGATLFITTTDIWNDLADQADGRFNITVGGIVDHAIAGFKFPVIEKDNVYYTWDPRCPSGEMYGVNLETWLVEVHRNHNFAWTGFRPKWLSEEGGGMYEWGQYHAQIRMTCRMPWLNCRIYNITTNG